MFSEPKKSQKFIFILHEKDYLCIRFQRNVSESRLKCQNSAYLRAFLEKNDRFKFFADVAQLARAADL